MKVNYIYNGDALEILKTLPKESINCVMTSPPYWALRDYGDSVQSIYGGDENCNHNFEIKERQLHSGTSNPDWEKDMSKGIRGKADWKTKDGFCSKCGAWKGQLGLEPTFDLFITHLCDIFDEVKRVLRKDGTCWVNLGDTYYNPSSQNSNDGRAGFTKFPKDKFIYSIGNKKCLICGKPTEKQFCSKKCLNKKGNEFRSQNRLLFSKCLTGIPFRFALEMINRGWILRNTIIWHKPNCMPSSVKDRFTVDFEYIFFFVKSKKYWFEQQREISQYEDREKRAKYGWNGVIVENIGRNQPEHLGRGDFANRFMPEMRSMRAVWKISPKPFPEAHFAVYPIELCETPLKSGCPINGIVLDPFIGSGTTGLVALKQNKKFVGIELNKDYIDIAMKRLKPFLEQNKLMEYVKNV